MMMKFPLLSKHCLITATLAVVLLILFAWQGWSLSRESLWSAYDSMHTAERSRQMLVSSDPLTVKRNFYPDYNKPPLQYWLTAPLLELFSNSVMALAFWPLLFGLACLVLSGVLTAQLQPEEKGLPFWTMAFLATSILFSHCCSVALLDTGMTAFLLLTAVGYEAARTRPWAWWLVGAGIVLGFLQKVPLGLLYLLLGILTDYLLKIPVPARRNTPFRAACWFWGIFGLIWPVSQLLMHGRVFWKRFFKEEMFNRVVVEHTKVETSSWDVVVRIWENWPYVSILALLGLMLYLILWKKNRFLRLMVPALFVAGYIGTVMLSSLSLERYLLPVFPFLALFAAWFLARIPGPGWFRVAVVLPVFLLLSLHDLWQRRERVIQDELKFSSKGSGVTDVEAQIEVLNQLALGLRELRKQDEKVVLFLPDLEPRFFYSGLAFLTGLKEPVYYCSPGSDRPKEKKIPLRSGAPILLLARPSDLETYPDLFPGVTAIQTKGEFSYYRTTLASPDDLKQRTY